MITLQDITTDNFDQCLALTVHENHAAKLYKSLGFVETSEIEHGENVIVLSF